MLELMLRAVMVGAFVTAAALLLERGLAHLRVGKRHAWTFALLATSLAPWLPRMTSVRVEALPVMEMPMIVVNTTSQAGARVPVNALVLGWVLLSILVLTVYAIAYLKLLRAQREWQPTRIAEDDVFLSERFGPAVFGFLAPRIVVPRWVQGASSDEQELIVLHEREHIRAGDQLQLLLTLVCTAITPWHPLVWWQARRLRFTIEADCDQRVLAAAPDRARYASLLVNVGSRQSELLLTPALAEHGNGLEARVRLLADQLIRKRWKAAGLIVVAFLVALVACETKLPNEPQQPQPRMNIVEQSLPRMQANSAAQVPVTTPSELAARYYPARLREAGIGGSVHVEATVRTTGAKDNVHVIKSAGEAELDGAAVQVVRDMQLLPRRVPEGQKPKDEVYRVHVFFDHPTPAIYIADVAAVTAGAGRTLPAMLEQQEQPRFTPYTDRPELANRDEIRAALVNNYPPLLRDAGIGGQVLAWVFVDKDGTVRRTIVKEGSGHIELDSAALRVVRSMRFLPAKNRGEAVPVWIALPVVFRSK